MHLGKPAEVLAFSAIHRYAYLQTIPERSVELDSIFNNKSDPSEFQTQDTTQITDLAQVILLVTNLKAELDTYKAEKAELGEKVRLITECCSIHKSDSQVVPEVVDLVITDNKGTTLEQQK